MSKEENVRLLLVSNADAHFMRTHSHDHVQVYSWYKEEEIKNPLSLDRNGLGAELMFATHSTCISICVSHWFSSWVNFEFLSDHHYL